MFKLFGYKLIRKLWFIRKFIIAEYIKEDDVLEFLSFYK